GFIGFDGGGWDWMIVSIGLIYRISYILNMALGVFNRGYDSVGRLVICSYYIIYDNSTYRHNVHNISTL
ncbi:MULTISPECIES: hypothetical protein, partial [Bacillus]|uniref:hypothetical protein n=1 Tax=Bacillus TaxID=1386 RepID=UPI001BDBA97C